MLQNVMMAGRTVELRVGGQTYRVVSSASESELAHLAGVVNDHLAHIAATDRPASAQALVLTAIALAHELENERERYAALAARTRDTLGRILERVDATLGADARVEDTSANA